VAGTEHQLCKLHWRAIGVLGWGEGMSTEKKLSQEVGEILKLTESPQQKEGPVATVPHFNESVNDAQRTEIPSRSHSGSWFSVK